MILNPGKDYGFTVLGARNTDGMPVWDKFRLEKIAEIYRTSSKILDFGNSSRALSELLSHLLKGKEKISVDINPDYNPDVVADICDMKSFEDESVDGIICAAVLEHVYNPFKAVAELHRILKKGGRIFLYLPFMYGYHAPKDGGYADFYRYSRDGVRYLLRDFSHTELCPVRGYLETIFNLIPPFAKGSLFIKLFGGLIRKFDRYEERHTSGFNVFAIK